MRISEVMTRDVRDVHPGDSLKTAAAKMAEIDVGSLPVTEGDRLVGVITDRDITVRAVAKGLPCDAEVARAMSSGVVTCAADTPVEEAAHLMSEKQIRRLYVTEGDRLAGVASLGDMALEEMDDAGEALREISKH